MSAIKNPQMAGKVGIVFTTEMALLGSQMLAGTWGEGSSFLTFSSNFSLRKWVVGNELETKDV